MVMVWKLKSWKVDGLGWLIYLFQNFIRGLGLLKNSETVNREEILGPESLQYW